MEITKNSPRQQSCHTDSFPLPFPHNRAVSYLNLCPYHPLRSYWVSVSPISEWLVIRAQSQEASLNRREVTSACSQLSFPVPQEQGEMPYGNQLLSELLLCFLSQPLTPSLSHHRLSQWH